MKAVSQTCHLARRNGVWSYRRRVPLSLIETFGKKVIQFSLNTTSLKEAKKRRAAEDLKWSTQFEAAEKNQASGGASSQGANSAAPGKPLSEREVTRLIAELYARRPMLSRQLSDNRRMNSPNCTDTGN